MAQANEIPMLIDLYKNTNTASRTYGQFYGRVFPRKGLSLKGFARHMVEHGKRVTYEEMVLIIQQMVSCLKELICQGVPVKLDGLGTFSPGITGTGSDSVESYNVAVNIKGVNFNFRPEGAGEDDEKLTKSALLSQVTFQMNDYVELIDSGKRDKDGKPIKYQKRTKISQQSLVNYDDGGGETPEP